MMLLYWVSQYSLSCSAIVPLNNAEQVWWIQSCAMELASFSTCLEDDFCHPCNVTPMQLLWLLDVLLARANTQLFRHWPWWSKIGKKYRIHFQHHLLLTTNEKYIWMISFFALCCCPMWLRLCNYCQLNSQLVFITPKPEQGISKDLKESLFGFSCSRETLEKS